VCGLFIFSGAFLPGAKPLLAFHQITSENTIVLSQYRKLIIEETLPALVVTGTNE